jgi:hypothetical protein
VCPILDIFLTFLAKFQVLQGTFFYFSPFSVFLAIFQFLPCEFLIFLLGHFTHHTPGPTLCISHFSRFSVFLAIFQIIHRLCLIIQFFQFSRHNPGPRVCISHFSTFSLFPTIFQVLQWLFLILYIFQCFLPYSSSYHVNFSFFLVGQFTRHSPGPTVCISHFSRFSVILAIFQIIQCLCLIIYFF